VDRYAPVTIAGALNPFDPMASLDITTSFKRVELTTLTPYSGKFAGYRIRKGRLNLDLHYLITKGQLKAENKLLVEQLQLGEKVDSPDAVDLPLRLAIALLKDSQGRIAIELPVSGDLNSPQFSVMPIVWQTLRNLMARAAQAPFKFIGGLVSGGGSEDLSTVSFSPGSDELSADAQAALMKLAAALKERPTLRLEIEGTSAQASDGPLIAEQRLEREYQSTYYKMAQRRGDKVPATAAEMKVPDEDKAAMLEAIYRTRLKGQPPVEWEQLESAARTTRLREAVLKSWASNNALLRQLGQARAGSIKDFLVDKGQLADARVYFIDAALGGAEKDGRIITPLHLDAE
jgi:outer membrane protein OmpA-like peptidoglycan-associated protein